MTVHAGTRLGPYEILAPLGAGGMGEVYRARDTRLGREVAVKVLPASFASDPDRLRRFEQEARAAGVLNHPNILAIYDVGSHEGSPFVVSELLEGQTLRQRLSGGPLPQRKAIDTALEIAHGLAAAHGQGIVHRDLKPENIFITKDGRVKILDFGLAKLTHPEGIGDALTELPTTPSGTEPGVVMGTVGYMSPEQVRGQPADHRSDIFAFGAILYEMLAGQRAFQGDSSVEIMHAILKEEPPEFEELKRHVSPGLDRVVRRCLEKDAEERFQSARDLGFALEAISGVSGITAAVPAIQVVPSRRHLLAALAVAGALMMAVVVSFVAGTRAGKTPVPRFEQLTFRRGFVQSGRFTPDGESVVYSAAWEGNPLELFSTRLGQPEWRSLGLAPCDLLAISRSGEMAIQLRHRFLLAWRSSGTLAQAPVGGGAPREILEDVDWADWAPDGTALAIVRQVEGRFRLEFPVGRVLYETSGWITHPRISPRGDLIAFLDHPIYADTRGSVAFVDRSGKKKTFSEVYAGAYGLAWAPAGDEIWFTAAPAGLSSALYAASLEGRVRLVARTPGALILQDVARAGRVLLIHENARRGILGLASGETKERDLSWLDWPHPRDLSPDGKTLLFDEEGEGAGGKYLVYIRKTDGSPAVRLGEGYAIGLSPDGKWALSLIPYVSPQQLVLWPTGPGESRRFPERRINYRWAQFLNDNKRILIVGSEAGRPVRLYVQNLEGGELRPIGPERISLGGAAISPDDRWVAAVDDKGNLSLVPIEGGEPRPIRGTEPGDRVVRWSADGQELFVTRPGEIPIKVFRLNLSTGRKAIWKEIVPSDRTGIAWIGPFLVTPDGKSYAYGYRRAVSDLFVVEGLK